MNGLDRIREGDQLRDEQRMIALILKGDTASFRELIRPYQRRVFTIAFSILHNEEDAEDTAQEAFIKAFNLARFRGEAKFSSWLISITLNEARSRYRRKAFVGLESRDVCIDETRYLPAAIARDSHETASQTLERLELHHQLQEAISLLPPTYREAVVLRYLEELSVAETAAVLNISIAAIKVRLFRARFMMKKRLAAQLNTGDAR